MSYYDDLYLLRKTDPILTPTDLWLGNCSLRLSLYQASSGAGLPPLTSQRSCTSSPSLTTRFPGPDTSGGPGGSAGENVVRREVSYKDHEDKKVSV